MPEMEGEGTRRLASSLVWQEHKVPGGRGMGSQTGKVQRNFIRVTFA